MFTPSQSSDFPWSANDINPHSALPCRWYLVFLVISTSGCVLDLLSSSDSPTLFSRSVRIYTTLLQNLPLSSQRIKEIASGSDCSFLPPCQYVIYFTPPPSSPGMRPSQDPLSPSSPQVPPILSGRKAFSQLCPPPFPSSQSSFLLTQGVL